MSVARYEITIKRTAVEQDQEIGRQWEKNGKKDEKGNDDYGYTPSEKGPKEVTRTVFQRECSAIDLDALGRLISKSEKANVTLAITGNGAAASAGSVAPGTE